MGGLGVPELAIIALVIVLLFGAAKLPKLARSMGEAQREFKKGLHEPGDEAAKADEKAAKAADEPVTMTRAELDAMLAEREAKARKDGNPA
jgi:sec-independent protein translocase protein TatA